MSERNDIILREEGGDGEGKILRELKQAVDQLFPTAIDSTRKWIKGKSEQEVAKVAEIKSKVYAQIGKMENERIKLIQDRDIAIKNAEITEKDNLRKHQREMYDLRTKRMKEVIDSILCLKNIGAEIDLEVIISSLMSAMESGDDKP